MKLRDLTGQPFGLFTVIKRADEPVRPVHWVCECICGSVFTARYDAIADGSRSCCGCQSQQKNQSGLSGSPSYVSWQGMHRRCYDTSHDSYKNYGGRGIRVCERWALFMNFYADMGQPPLGMTLDRIKSNVDYQPDNCRWADRKTQNRNTKSNRLVTHNGITQSIPDWADQHGMPPLILWRRLYKGWDMERALNQPIIYKPRG